MPRQLRARVHPDAGGSHELSIWTAALLEHVESCADVVLCSAHSTQTTQDRSAPYTGNVQGNGGHASASSGGEDVARVPFPYPVDHAELLVRALEVVLGDEDLDDHVAGLLCLLGSYEQATSGRGRLAESRGASYKQLRFLAALANLEPKAVYDLGERVPLSQGMCHHMISKLKEGG